MGGFDLSMTMIWQELDPGLSSSAVESRRDDVLAKPRA
jgi:hypothetical protein